MSADAAAPDRVASRRLRLAALAAAAALSVAAYAGPRAGLLLLIGLGFGLVMEGLRFGFAGPWRQIATDRDARGLLAQLLAIALASCATLPLLAAAPDELIGAHAPVGVGMALGAFAFGFCMQIVMGCGSGTLLNAGSGNLVGAAALPGFILGSFLGTLHLGWWSGLGALPTIALQDALGTAGALSATLAGLALVAALALMRAAPGKRLPPPRLWLAAALVAGLAALNLMIAGQPWGVVYGLGLWGAKIAEAGGMELAATAFWSASGNAERLREHILTDATSLTNIGLALGAYLVMRWRAAPAPQTAALTAASWLAVALAAVAMGYSARIAFGCNVGAFFSGIASGSLHGWVWLVAAFAGSTLGVAARGALLVPARVPAARTA